MLGCLLHYKMGENVNCIKNRPPKRINGNRNTYSEADLHMGDKFPKHLTKRLTDR